MAIVGRTPTVAESASATSIAATLPTDRQAGDLTVVVYSLTNPGTVTPPAGWTALFTPSGFGTSNTVMTAAYYQFSASSAPTISHSGSAGRITALAQAYGGGDAPTPVEVAAVVSQGTGTSLVATGVTTVTAGALMLSGYVADTSGSAATYPSGMTGVIQYAASGAGGRLAALAQESRASAGATGTRTWTTAGGTSLNMQAWTTALRPAVQSFTGTLASTSSITGQLLTGMSGSRPQTFSAAGALNLGVTMGGSRASTASLTGALSVISRQFVGTLEVEFTAGVWTDVTSRMALGKVPLRIRQGRPTPFEDVSGAVLTCALYNSDGALMPDNQGSPWWPNVVNGKRIRWRVAKSGTTYTRFLGKIQAIRPEYPSTSTNDAMVSIQAVDSLGALAQRKLRSNFTETVIWRSRLDSVACDAYEASGQAAGSVAIMTNYSTDAAAGIGSSLYGIDDATLSFGDDPDTSIGGVVTANSEQTNKTEIGLQANALQLILHLKGPWSLLAASILRPAATLIISGVGTVGHLVAARNGTANGLYVYNAAMTVSFGLLANLPMAQWVRITGISNAGTPARTDWRCTFGDGSSSVLNGTAIDVRTVTLIWLPAGTTPSMQGSWGGIAALGTRTGLDYQESFVGMGTPRALSSRVGHVANTVAPLGVGISTAGTLTGTVATGEWSGRPAAAVLQEMLRTHGGLAWAWQADPSGSVYALASDATYPAVPLATVDLDADCQGPPQLASGSEQRPTRVEATWPGGTAVARDAATEAGGEQRSKTVSTVAPTLAIAQARAQAILDRALAERNVRISRVTVSLVTGATDHTGNLFGEADYDDGLHPTARIRTVVPVSHFGVPTLDHHVQGWEETYSPNDVTVAMDTTPAVPTTLLAETWTGPNGSAWSGSWAAAIGAGTTGSTTDVQSNRGRIVSGAGGAVWRRASAFTADDVDITGLVQVQGTAEAQLWWRTDSLWQNGYGLVFSTSGGVRVQQIAAGAITTRYNAGQVGGPSIVAGTDYRFRLRHMGPYLCARVWAAAGSEPGTWSLQATDSLYTAPGCVAVAQWTASQTALFDNLTITTGA